jgi:hypothetical protein
MARPRSLRRARSAPTVRPFAPRLPDPAHQPADMQAVHRTRAETASQPAFYTAVALVLGLSLALGVLLVALPI